MSGTIIYHVDVNSAFLSWEAAHRLFHLGGQLDLRTIPSAVCGDIAARHGIILAKSIPAKKYGIKTGMPVTDAKRLCPSLYAVPPNYSLYERCSKALIELLLEYTPIVEQYSIDEAFMDMSSTIDLFGEPKETALKLRDQIYQELGFTVNIGVSVNKLLAKMAGEFKKPNLVHTLFPEEIPVKMWPLPVSELFFVGRATEKKLLNLGIRTIGDLAHADPVMLRTYLKKQGDVIRAFAQGHDVSLVESAPPPQKGYGNSTTIAFDVADASTAKLILLALAETVGTRLRKAGVQAEVVTVGLKSFDLHYQSHQMLLENPTHITQELHHYACLLFEQLWDGKTPIRHMALHTGRLRDASSIRQMNLFDSTDYEKLERLDTAIDKIRSRYGIDSVMRASFLKSPIDHLSGGISREKRTIDYQNTRID